METLLLWSCIIFHRVLPGKLREWQSYVVLRTKEKNMRSSTSLRVGSSNVVDHMMAVRDKSWIKCKTCGIVRKKRNWCCGEVQKKDEP
jgi:hypothetical protein